MLSREEETLVVYGVASEVWGGYENEGEENECEQRTRWGIAHVGERQWPVVDEIAEPPMLALLTCS